MSILYCLTEKGNLLPLQGVGFVGRLTQGVALG